MLELNFQDQINLLVSVCMTVKIDKIGNKIVNLLNKMRDKMMLEKHCFPFVNVIGVKVVT